MALPDHKTKIIATIGPSSDSQEVMEDMLRAGMNVARLNFSHGDFDAHGQAIERLRAAESALGQRLALMADLPGPKMRIGTLVTDPLELNRGDHFTLTTEPDVSEPSRVSVTFDRLHERVKPGDALFLNDGLIRLSVTAVEGRDVHCNVDVGGELRSRKGLNLPGIDLGICAFTERDRQCLAFALEHGVDAISQSFVERAADVEAVREAARSMGHDPFIIAKIERAGALRHLEEVLDAANGIMVARGDLGVEIPIERIAVEQKRIIREANRRAKPVITATHMLESMINSTRPTRAEATDVANAILDGTDCVMLSGESAVGRYPVESVAMLAKIAKTTESLQPGQSVRAELTSHGDGDAPDVRDVMAFAVNDAIVHLPVSAIFAPSHSGKTARDIARFRLPVWVIATSRLERTCQGLVFSYGIYPVHTHEPPEDWNAFAQAFLDEHEVEGKLAILVAGPSARRPHANFRLEIIAL